MDFVCGTIPVELQMPLDADDSLDSNETVSLNAESLSGLSVRDSRIATLVSALLPLLQISDDDIEMVELVVLEIRAELDRN